MEKELLIVLERIATALEKIADSLNKNPAEKPIFVRKSNVKEVGKTDNIVNNYRIIEEFLNSRNIKIKNIPPEEEVDKILDKIAVYMGNNFSLIRSFYELIKHNINSGLTVKLELKNKRQEEINAICNLAKRLHEIAFLEEYKYFNSPKYILYARPNRIPKVMSFFSGKWLERFIKSQTILLLQKMNPNLNIGYLLNPQIKLPNGDDFEFDLLLSVENDIYWFEAKTGDYQRYMEKYSKISKILELGFERSFMILTDITPTGAEALRTIFYMNVVPIENFSEEFNKIIIKYKSTSLEPNNLSDTRYE